jgi:predicted enzyme related to lactoylglutathione lyase
VLQRGDEGQLDGLALLVAGRGRRVAVVEAEQLVWVGLEPDPTAHPLWLPYVEVADINDTHDQARRLGATVLLTPREGPMGWRSVVATPAAGEIALWQPKR